MWYFYAVAIPVTLGMVVYTLHRFASPKVLSHVRLVVSYAWFVNMSIVILVPFDVWTTICHESAREVKILKCSNPFYINLLWSITYWSAFFLTWFIIPTMQGYEDAADFTVIQRIKTSIRGNLRFNCSVGTVVLVGATILLATKELAWDNLKGLAIGASNAFALVTGALLLGFGLIELPRGLWRHADPVERFKWLSQKVAKVAEKLDEAHQELSTVLVITQATSSLISKRDPLRPMMDVIDAMASEDVFFKPSGGRLGETDMEYDMDEKTMAALRRRLRRAQNFYSRYNTEYTAIIWQALEVEDTIRNLESEDRKFVSRLRPPRQGVFGEILDYLEWQWRCVFHSKVLRIVSVLLAALSTAIIFAEATMLFYKWFDLSLFSILVRSAGLQEETVKVLVSIPLVYICVCTYFSVFKLGMFSFYYLVPGHTDSVSLLMNCSMVSRYAAPMCYNFLSLIHLTHVNKTTRKVESLMTTFEERMNVLPEEYERIYPLVMVVWCLLIYGNVHNRLMDVFGSWRRFRFESDEDYESDGSSTTGLIILRRERASFERGMAFGENVVPLARHFANGEDIESIGTGDKHDSPPASSKTSGESVDQSREDASLYSSAAANKASARDAMVSLYRTLKEAVPSSSNIYGGEGSEKKLSGLGETHRAMAAKYANIRADSKLFGDADSGVRGYVGKMASDDSVGSGRDLRSVRAVERQSLVARSPLAPFRHSIQHAGPPNAGPDAAPESGVLFDAVKSRLKGLATTLVPAPWVSEGEARTPSPKVGDSTGLSQSKRYQVTQDTDAEDQSYSLLGDRKPSSKD